MASRLELSVVAKNQASAVLKQISGDIAGLGKQATSVSQQLKSMGQGMTMFGTGLTAGITAPLVGLGLSSINAAAEMEQLDIAFTTMLGSADKAKKLMEELTVFSAQTPFEMTEVVAAGRQLLAFGIEAEDIETTLRQLGDVAAGVGAPIGDLAYLFGTAAASGRLMTVDINQFAMRGIPILEALGQVMGVTASEVRAMAAEGKIGAEEMKQAFALMGSEGGKFAGLMAAQSQSVKGLFSTVKDNVGQTLTVIGQQIIDTFDLKRVLGDAIVYLEQMRTMITDLAKNNPALFKMAIGFGVVAAAIGPVVLGLGMVATAIGTALPVITAVGGALSGLALPFAAVAGAAALLYYDVGGVRTLLVGFGKDVISFASDTMSALSNYRATIADAGAGSIEAAEAIGLFPASLQGVARAFDSLLAKLPEVQAIGADTMAALAWVWEGKAANIDWWGDITDGLVGLGIIGQETGDKLAAALFDAGVTFDTVKAKITDGWLSIKDTVTVAVAGFVWSDFIESLTWDNIVTTTIDWATFIAPITWDTVVTVIDWATYIGQLTWDNAIVPALDWAAYVAPLAWDAVITTLSNWGAYITALDWTAIITTVIDWATWIPALSWAGFVTAIEWGAYIVGFTWSAFVSVLDWAAFVNVLTWENLVAALDWAGYIVAFTWDSFIAKLEWTGTITKLENWASYIPTLSWADTVTTLGNWGAYIQPLAWSTFLGALNWSGYIAALSWESVVTGLTDWGAYITALDWATVIATALDWANYITPLAWVGLVAALDWAAYIAPLAWDTIVSTLGDWGAYITTLDWTSIITTAIDWATWIPALSWAGFITGLEWSAYLAVFSWSTFVSVLDWATVAGSGIDWTAFVNVLSWENLVTTLDWVAYISAFTWDSFITKLEWTGTITKLDNWGVFVSDLAWSSYVAVIDWATVAPTLAWKTFVTPLGDWATYIAQLSWSTYVNALGDWGQFVAAVDWSAFLTGLSWAAFVSALAWSAFIPGFSWATFIPRFSWPTLPSFPGWNSLIPDFLGGGAPAQPDTNATGTRNYRGGWSWVGEAGRELMYVPPKADIYSNRASMGVLAQADRDAMAGADGGDFVTVNVYNTFNASSNIDIEAAAYKIADVIRRRR